MNARYLAPLVSSYYSFFGLVFLQGAKDSRRNGGDKQSLIIESIAAQSPKINAIASLVVGLLIIKSLSTIDKIIP